MKPLNDIERRALQKMLDIEPLLAYPQMTDADARVLLSSTPGAFEQMSVALRDLRWAVSEALDAFRCCDRVDGRWVFRGFPPRQRWSDTQGLDERAARTALRVTPRRIVPVQRASDRGEATR